VIRFKSPQDEKLVLKDIIRGEIHIDTNILDDKVLFKSDGMPTYHLAIRTPASNYEACWKREVE